ncbi:hypothetical protein [Pseudomonas sp. RGB]|uniref:hypothetical protein n=1 Tax=Pseudomonas sp. RGB TaxID=2598474 RepID=UPI002114C968|nr:hypothetical protein [Pseudomonas sp. RGB]
MAGNTPTRNPADTSASMVVNSPSSEAMFSHTVPFGDAVQAFELAADKTQAMKVVLDFGVADLD